MADNSALSSLSPQPGPWQDIAEIIRDISQETWAAGWLIDAEHVVYGWTLDASDASPFVRERVPELVRLAKAGGHWVRWDTKRGGIFPVVPVRMDRWRRRHEEWRAAGGHPRPLVVVPPAR